MPRDSEHKALEHSSGITATGVLALCGIFFTFLGPVISIAVFGEPVVESWRIVFLVAAALAVGFGAATLLYRRRMDARMNDLESDYQDLSQRAQMLLRQAERFERQSNIEQKMAAR